MNGRKSPSRDTERSLLSSITGSRHRRRLVRILRERSDPLTERDLAVKLAAMDGETSPSDLSTEERLRMSIVLHHRVLPALSHAGLINRRSEGIVATERLSTQEIASIHSEIRDVETLSEDAIAALLTRPRRQHVVSIVAEGDGPRSLDDLATELASHQQFTDTATGAADGPGLRARLHHVDLPKLDDVGVIEYDVTSKTISPGPHLTEDG